MIKKIKSIIEKAITRATAKTARPRMAVMKTRSRRLETNQGLVDSYAAQTKQAILDFCEKNKVTFGGGEDGSIDHTHYMVPLEKIKEALNDE